MSQIPVQPVARLPLDIDTAIEISRPETPRPWVRMAALAGVGLVVISLLQPMQSLPGVWQATLTLVPLGLFAAVMLHARAMGLRLGNEAAAVRTLQDHILLQQWQQAAGVVIPLLSSPMKTHEARLHALSGLARVLYRYDQFDDVVHLSERLQEEFADEVVLPAMGALKAMCLLRMDRLFDADQALGDLRRKGLRESSAVVLAELYRTVKTGHLDDATAFYTQQSDRLRRDARGNVADGLALAAAACVQADEPRARELWLDATSLVPAGELVRRYPELKSVATSLAACPVPGGAR